MSVIKKIIFVLYIVIFVMNLVYSFEIDSIGTVERVVDGDTIYVKVEEGRFSGNIIKVRLADINAPELSTEMGERAKLYLESLLLNKKVYLDIDDLYTTDKYGRIVAVVYLLYNETHLLNVNLYLYQNNYSKIVDYNNEFNPKDWNLYVEYNSSEKNTGKSIGNLELIPIVLILIIILSIVIVFVYFFTKKGAFR